MILFTIYRLFTKMLYDGDGRITGNIQKTKQRKKIHVWLLYHPRRLRSGDRLFSSVRKHRKQSGPTLSGRGFLIEWGKKKDRVGRVYEQLIAGNMNFVCVKFQDLQEKRAEVRVEVPK